MDTSIGKLLTTGLDTKDLYGFSAQLMELFTDHGEAPTVLQPYMVVIKEVMGAMDKVFARNRTSPFTIKINQKHRQRVNLLIALKRQISAAQKLDTHPQIVAAAHNLQRELATRGWWKYQKLFYQQATALVRPLLIKAQEESFRELIETIGCVTIIEDLEKIQGEFEALFNARFEETEQESIPLKIKTRKRLLKVNVAFLHALNFGAEHFPEIYGQLGIEVSRLIIAVNSTTRTRKTLMKQQSVNILEPEVNAAQDPELSADTLEAGNTELADINLGREINSIPVYFNEASDLKKAFGSDHQEYG